MGINLPTSTGEFTGFLNQQPYFTRSAWSLAGLDGPMPGDCFSDARFQWCYRRRCPKNGVMFFFQEISNRTQWMDPYTWVSNSSSNLLRGPLVRSCLFFLFFLGCVPLLGGEASNIVGIFNLEKTWGNMIPKRWNFKYRWDFHPEEMRKWFNLIYGLKPPTRLTSETLQGQANPHTLAASLTGGGRWASSRLNHISYDMEKKHLRYLNLVKL